MAVWDLWLIGVLVLVAVTCALWGMYAMRQAARRRVRDLIEAPRRKAAPPAAGGRHRPLARLGALLSRLLPGAVLEDVQWRLLWAGRPFGWSPEEFLGARAALATVLAALGWAVAAGNPGVPAWFLAVALGLFGYTLPGAWLGARIAARRQQVQRELPLFLDLLAAAVEAGLGLGEAVRRVAEELPGLVAAEFLRAQQEMAAGKPRAAAWRDLMDRTPSPELRAVVLSILQADQYGTAIVEQLQAQVRQIWAERQRKAQELAQAASVKMRLPMIVFILLPFIALIIGPAIIGLAELLTQ